MDVICELTTNDSCTADDAIKVRDTLYPWTGLSVLVDTHVSCLLRYKRRTVLFLSCTRRLRAELVLRRGTPCFPPTKRLPSTTNTIPIVEPR